MQERAQYPDAVPNNVPPAMKSPPAISPQVVVGNEEIFEAHVAGKLSVALKAPLDTQRALSIAYTPGVAQVSRAIAADHTLAAGARRITETMMVAAAEAIFSVVSDDLAPDRIVPSPLDLRVGEAVASAVATASDA
jgi:malic enzyme